MAAFDLRRDGVTMITYDEALRQAVLDAALAAEEFFALPDEFKQRFNMADDHAGAGYELKVGAGRHGDRKENFDFTLRSYDQLHSLLRPEDIIATHFLAAAAKLGELVVPMIAAFGQEVEALYGVEGFAALAKRSADGAFFRFLRYPQAEEAGDVMAEPHVDHSGFTFHLHETSPGCERLGFDGTWQPLPVANGLAVAFGGMQLQLVSNGELRGLVHRVVADERSAEVGRQAIVCFIALDGMPMYDRAKHGRLQELLGIDQGATYVMPQGQFAGLFEVKA